jgi:hypothetical protein
VVEWWSGGVVEWWSGGVVEWWSGGVVERWSRVEFFIAWKKATTPHLEINYSYESI